MPLKPVSATKALALLLSAIGIVLLTGCVSFWSTSRHQSSSVVQFLYPGNIQTVVKPSTPTLRLPLRVGLAFVPPPASPGMYRSYTVTYSEAQMTGLMRAIANKFRALPFVQSIELVPTTYLRPGGGFENLDQLRAIMGVDAIALVAFDQIQNTGDTAWSLSYWTIVGAYIVPAQKNDTHTLMEAVVYDIASRTLLFRAPGVSAVKGRGTLVGNEADLRTDSIRGYTEAARDLTVKLQVELDAFKVRIRDEPQSVRIEHKAGYHGAGQWDTPLAGLLGILLAGRIALRSRAFFHRAK